MDTQIDWREELDASIGRGPDVPTVQYVAAGRRAVRHRQMRIGSAGLATAAAIGAIAWATAPGAPSPKPDILMAAEPTASPTTATTATTKPVALPWRQEEPPARATRDEGVEIRAGAVVHERRDAVLPGEGINSAALDLSYEGERVWMVLEWDDGGATEFSEAPGEQHDTFESFVAETVAQGGDFTLLSRQAKPLATLSTNDGLRVRPGVEVVERVENPLERKSPNTSVGLALRKDGVTTWLLLDAWSKGHGSSTSSELESESGWLRFDQWLTDAVSAIRGIDSVGLVAIDGAGHLTPDDPGVEILEQVADPELGNHVDATTISSAVAKVAWEGSTWFIIAARHPGQDVLIPYAAEKAGGAETIEEFLAFAISHIEDGSGMR